MKSSIIQNIHNSYGFSLVEVLIVVGLVGIISVSVLTMMDNIISSVNGIEVKQDINSLQMQMQSQMALPSSCKKALVDSVNPSFNRNLASVSSIQNSPGQAFRWMLDSGESLFSGANNPNRKIKINNLYFLDSTNEGTIGANTLHKVNLFGEFEATSKVIGPKILKRHLGTIFLEVDSSNKIVECYNTGVMADSSIAKVCQMIGVGFDSVSKKCDFTSFLTPTNTDNCTVTVDICVSTSDRMQIDSCGQAKIVSDSDCSVPEP